MTINLLEHYISSELDMDKNCNINFDKLTTGSGKKLWWKCAKEHSWKASVSNRIYNKSGCPYCSGRKACEDNCLVATHPHLLQEWDFDKNIIKPDNITSGSHQNVHWRCKNNHKWQTTVNNRTNHKTQCPFCSNQRICHDNCLSLTHPNLLCDWNYGKNLMSPNEISIGHNSKIWWICQKGHEWEAKVRDRAKGIGCPYCANKKVCKDNCLATTHPQFLNEWNFQKNIINPYEVTAGSDKKVWWICEMGHEWEARIYTRCLNKAGCPNCSKFVSKKSQVWLDLLKIKDREIVIVINKKRYKVDGFDLNTNTVYEFNGDYWHGNPKIYNPNDIHSVTGKSYLELYEKTRRKENEIKLAGYNYISIWESDFDKIITHLP